MINLAIIGWILFVRNFWYSNEGLRSWGIKSIPPNHFTVRKLRQSTEATYPQPPRQSSGKTQRRTQISWVFHGPSMKLYCLHSPEEISTTANKSMPCIIVSVRVIDLAPFSMPVSAEFWMSKQSIFCGAYLSLRNKTSNKTSKCENKQTDKL